MDSIVLSYLRQLVPDGTVQPVSLSQSSDQPHQSPRVPKFEKERMRQKSNKNSGLSLSNHKKTKPFPFCSLSFSSFLFLSPTKHSPKSLPNFLNFSTPITSFCSELRSIQFRRFSGRISNIYEYVEEACREGFFCQEGQS